MSGKQLGLSEPFWKWAIIAASICGALTAFVLVSLKSENSGQVVQIEKPQPKTTESDVTEVEVGKVVALPKSITMQGTIQPEGGIIGISIPADDRLYKTLVREGDTVKPNQPLVYLESFLKLKAQSQYIESYYKNLNRFKDCSKSKNKNSELSLIVNKNLSVYNSYCLQSLSSEQVQNIRVNELPKLQASIASINSQIEASIIRAPRQGKILKVFRNPDISANKTVMYLGDTRSMFVIARLSASDYPYFEAGKTCKISSPAFGDIEVTGKTTGTGSLIRDSYFDASVKIDNTKAVSDFSNLKVAVVCFLEQYK